MTTWGKHTPLRIEWEFKVEFSETLRRTRQVLRRGSRRRRVG